MAEDVMQGLGWAVARKSPELDLLSRAQAGDGCAYRSLVEPHLEALYRVAARMSGCPTLAEDAVQDIFVRLWQTADRFDPRRARLVTWVMLIARRHLIDQLRRKAVRPKPSLLDEDLTAERQTGEPGHKTQTDERNSELRKQLARLPELQRVVIERSYLQGYTLREVSQQLDTPLGTIKSALSRGLNKLRDQAQGEPNADWAAS